MLRFLLSMNFDTTVRENYFIKKSWKCKNDSFKMVLACLYKTALFIVLW